MLAFVRRAGVACFRDRFWGWPTLVGASLLAACGFPKYDFVPSGVGGSAGSGAGNAGFSGSAAGAGADSGTGGDGTGGAASGGGGAGGEAAGGGVGAVGGLSACPASAGTGGVATMPSHCSNGKKDGDETGSDCGGPVCGVCFHSEGCHADTDCISGDCTAASTCQPLFDFEFKTVVAVRNTNTLQFLLKLTYLDTAPVQLKDIALRYYFARGDVADPVVPFSTVALLNGTTSIAMQTRWNIVRVLPDATALADSYLEITFTSTRALLQNDFIELTQSIEDGSAAGREFDQFTHYSFQNVTDYAPEEKGTVYRQGELVWGTPPPYQVPDQCFFTAVNFAGDALTAGGLAFQAGAAPFVAFNGSVFRGNATLTPQPDSAHLPMLESAIVLDTASATLNVPNGKYWVYPYVLSGDGTNTADLLIQGTTVGTFSAESVAGAPAWAKLGPYQVTVNDNGLVLSSSGGPLRVAGVELYQVAQ